ncbi:uncharacterized protein LOC115413632 isoform X2 [Sphaeramia orbicularis]|nr:uncharacterized protein LOC115413632 isoform X2 [Sphaeramia orbicularis]
MSSTPERVTIPHRTLPLVHNPAGRHGCYSMFLDPYDGSSEDSDESNIDVSVSAKGSRRPRQPGGGGGRSRRSMFRHPASVVKNCTGDKVTEEQHVSDVQMKCGSDSELTFGGFGGGTSNDSGKHTTSMDLELHCQLKDSDLHASGSSTPGPVPPVEVGTLPHSSSEKPPCHLRSLHKRKLDLPGLDVLELEQRKKQCLVNMVDEELKEVDSASEVC